MVNDQSRAEIAARIIVDRQNRYRFFPGEIFDEFAWNMLLHMFVALTENRIVTEDALILAAHAPTAVGQRWIYGLARDGHVQSRMSGDDVVLTSSAIRHMRLYLDTVQANWVDDAPWNEA